MGFPDQQKSWPVPLRLRSVQDDKFTVMVNGLKSDRVRKAKCLGVVIDDELLWHKQVNDVTKIIL